MGNLRGNNTLNASISNINQGNYESPSIVSMNSTNSNHDTPNSGVLINEVSDLENHSDGDLLTPDSCLSETSYLMNLFHPNNRLDNSRFDRPEVKALKEKRAQANNIDENARKRKKSNSALAYFDESFESGRKYSNPISRPKINRNNMVAAATAQLQRVSNASQTSSTNSAKFSVSVCFFSFVFRFVSLLFRFVFDIVVCCLRFDYFLCYLYCLFLYLFCIYFLVVLVIIQA